jgi:hypothetical protein
MQSNRVDPQDRVSTLHYRYGGLDTASTTPNEGCGTHGQLSPVQATRWGTPFYEWHEWDVHQHILLKALLKGVEEWIVFYMHEIGHAADVASMQHTATSGRSFATRIPE